MTTIQDDVEARARECPFCGGEPYPFKGGVPFARETWAACYGNRKGFEHSTISMPLAAWNIRPGAVPADGDVAGMIEPWADYHGDLPDYDHPLRCVYESGIQYAVELLAKELGVEDYEPCDGTEEFDGDLGGTMMNIVMAALPKDEHGDPLRPSEVCERFAALAYQPPEAGRDYQSGVRDAAAVALKVGQCANTRGLDPALERIAEDIEQEILALLAPTPAEASEHGGEGA